MSNSMSVARSHVRTVKRVRCVVEQRECIHRVSFGKTEGENANVTVVAGSQLGPKRPPDREFVACLSNALAFSSDALAAFSGVPSHHSAANRSCGSAGGSNVATRFLPFDFALYSA
jgi:hypothetical protein